MAKRVKPQNQVGSQNLSMFLYASRHRIHCMRVENMQMIISMDAEKTHDEHRHLEDSQFCDRVGSVAIAIPTSHSGAPSDPASSQCA